MRKDYSITIFSRQKGKTFSFNLDRRFIYVPVLIFIFLVISCVLLGQSYIQQREERQRLEGRVALLEELMDKFEERAERRGGEISSEGAAKAAAQPAVEVAVVQKEEEKKEKVPEPPVPEIRVGGNAEVDPRPIARIDEAKVSALEGDRKGFRFGFKLVNLIDEPIAGNVAIIAALRSPHQPRFVSFPSMKLNDGMPVKLRKSVGYSIRYFKEVTGRFYFPFSYSESFRILVYDQNEELLLDSTVLAKDVPVDELQPEEPAPSVYPSELSEPSEPSEPSETFEPTGPTDPSLSS